MFSAAERLTVSMQYSAVCWIVLVFRNSAKQMYPQANKKEKT
jgi:hypothetical protein